MPNNRKKKIKKDDSSRINKDELEYKETEFISIQALSSKRQKIVFSKRLKKRRNCLLEEEN